MGLGKPDLRLEERGVAVVLRALSEEARAWLRARLGEGAGDAPEVPRSAVLELAHAASADGLTFGS